MRKEIINILSEISSKYTHLSHSFSYIIRIIFLCN